jgi:RimJ/RimL family protein N-acetyltransferase
MTLDLGHLILTGGAVTLRPLELDDAAALAAATAESRASYGFNPVPDGLEQMRAFIERAFELRRKGERYSFCTLWQGRPVGSTSFLDFQPWVWPAGHPLQRTDRPDVVEIGGTWLAQSAQRTGCNTGAKFLMLRHAFEQWETHRVAFRTDERNARSRAAIERLGARLEGVRRAERPGQDGTVRNSVFYSIIAAEWPQAKEKLQARLLSSSAGS